MKQFILLCLVAICLLPACNNNKPKQITIEDKNGKGKVTINTNEIAERANEMNQKIEELKKLAPLSLDQLKAMIPEEFMGMKRSSFNAHSMTGAGTCNATYKSDDGKELRISVFDCAGEAGAGLYGMRFYNLWNFEEENDNGYTKTVDFNGGKAIEKYTKYNDRYGLTYVANDRLLVSLEGEKMGLDGVKDAAKNLSLK